MGAEIEFLNWIQDNLACGFMDGAMSFVSLSVTANIIWMVLGVYFLYRKDTRTLGAVLLLGLGICMLLGNGIIKNVVQRPRPFMDYPFDLIIGDPTGWSFPSGHTTGAFTAATCVFLFNRKLGAALYGYAALVAFSRMYLYVHYPTDILGGIVLGVFSALLAYCVVKKYLLPYTEPDGRPEEQCGAE